jgi:hypothetical protein
LFSFIWFRFPSECGFSDANKLFYCLPGSDLSGDYQFEADRGGDTGCGEARKSAGADHPCPNSRHLNHSPHRCHAWTLPRRQEIHCNIGLKFLAGVARLWKKSYRVSVGGYVFRMIKSLLKPRQRLSDYFERWERFCNTGDFFHFFRPSRTVITVFCMSLFKF